MSLTCFSYILHTPLTLPIFLQSIKRWCNQVKIDQVLCEVQTKNLIGELLLKFFSWQQRILDEDDPVCDDSEQGGQDQAGKVV